MASVIRMSEAVPILTAQEVRRDGFLFFCVYCGHDCFFHWRGAGGCQDICECDHFASVLHFHKGEEAAEPCD